MILLCGRVGHSSLGWYDRRNYIAMCQNLNVVHKVIERIGTSSSWTLRMFELVSWNCYEFIYCFVEHRETISLSLILKWLPFQFLHHCCDAAVPTVVWFHKSCCPSLHCLKRGYKTICVWVPYGWRVFKARSYLTRQLYASSFVDLEQPAMFRLSIPRDCDDFFTALSTKTFHQRFALISTPRYG